MAAVTKYNYISPGFAAATILLKGENEDDFFKIHCNFLNEFAPATHMELTLIEKMVHNQWLSLRAIRLQSERMLSLEPGQEIPKDIGLLIRYQTAADRAFHKCHAELLKLQKERQKSENGFVRETAAETPEAPAKTASKPSPNVEIIAGTELEPITEEMADAELDRLEREIAIRHANLQQAA